MLSKPDLEFYAKDEIKRYSDEFYHDEKELGTDFTKDNECL